MAVQALTIEPGPGELARLAQRGAVGTLAGHAMSAWRIKTRRELSLAEDRPVIATGHQAMLWHPGILAKFLVVDALAGGGNGFDTANLVVDQHAGGFGEFSIPVRKSDGSLGERVIPLTAVRPDVPMALHEPFVPQTPPRQVNHALGSVAEGVVRIMDAVRANRDAPNAALQMSCALGQLMRPWVRPMPSVTASDLMETSLARAVLAKMADDPWECALHYNRAVAGAADSGIGPLLVRDDVVELPLWRIREDGRRMHAYDCDLVRWLEGGEPVIRLMPRALLMTALVRTGMCDLFIHGTGGAKYDLAMESWIREWLGVEASPIGVATATLRLPLLEGTLSDVMPVPAAQRAMHSAVHNPEAVETATRPGPRKQAMLAEIDRLPRRSAARRQAYFEMHRRLASMSESSGRLAVAHAELERAKRRAADAQIANRRTWAFPLYPKAMIDALSQRVQETAHAGRHMATESGPSS